MEIKLKNEIFSNGFMGVIQKLMGRRMTPATAYVLGKFADEVDRNAKIYMEAHQKVQKEYAKLDKDGELIKLPACSVCGKAFPKGTKKKFCDFVFRDGRKCRGNIIPDGRIDIPEKDTEKAEKAFQELRDVEETYNLIQKVKLDDDEELTPSDARLIGDILDLDLEEEEK